MNFLRKKIDRFFESRNVFRIRYLLNKIFGEKDLGNLGLDFSDKPTRQTIVQEIINLICMPFILTLFTFYHIFSYGELFYNNPKSFQNVLTSQRLLRKLDEVHILDGAGNIIMSNIIYGNCNQNQGVFTGFLLNFSFSVKIFHK